MPDRIQYAARKGFRCGRGPPAGMTILLLGAVLGAFPLAVTGSGISGAMGRPALMARIYTSEVPSSTADDGLFVRMAVIIPPRAEVANVEAFMDVEDFGRSMDRWRPCNLDTGECEVEGGRVQGLRRLEYPDRGEVLLDFWNEHPVEPRFAKLRVTFRPQGNLRKTYVPRECWLRTECGYAGWMDLSIVDDSDLSGRDQ
jgi:hypothetical protein